MAGRPAVQRRISQFAIPVAQLGAADVTHVTPKDTTKLRNISNCVVVYRRIGRVISNTFGPSTGQIWLDDARCSGNEPSIVTCSHLPWGTHNCGHSEDVAIECSKFFM